jgi:hypothetical protein
VAAGEPSIGIDINRDTFGSCRSDMLVLNRASTSNINSRLFVTLVQELEQVLPLLFSKRVLLALLDSKVDLKTKRNMRTFQSLNLEEK